LVTILAGQVDICGIGENAPINVASQKNNNENIALLTHEEIFLASMV
jgi:hypothetical protein